MRKSGLRTIFASALLSLFLLRALPAGESEDKPTPTPVPKPGKWQQYWIDHVEEFKEENKTLDPEKKNIVFLGDSLTRGFKLKTYFPDLPVLNRGIVADGVANFPEGKLPWRGITNRLKESLYDCNPSHLFFMIGTNDVGASSVPFEYWLGNHKYVIRQAKKKFPDIRIILLTCPPTGTSYKRHVYLNERILKWNELVTKCAKEEGCRLIDVHALLAGDDGLLPAEMTRDGLHFNHIGYDRLVKKVRDILEADGLIKKE